MIMIVFKITFLFELAVLFSQIAFSQADTMITRKETITMKHFSLLVRVPETYNSEKAKLVNPQWDKLVEEWKDTGVYVLSFAFPGESYTVSGEIGRASCREREWNMTVIESIDEKERKMTM